MWEPILEWCAEILGVTVRSRLGLLVLGCAVLLGLGIFLSLRWGYEGWVGPVLLVAFAVVAARQVTRARDAVWRAACRPLDAREPHAVDAPPHGLMAPTAASLRRLAEAVDAVRRARYVVAAELTPQVHRDLLRPEEIQLLDAVRAMISVGLGSTQRAAQQAVTALPTGSEELDTCLGRAMVTDAWNDPGRLTAIERAWDRAGVSQGPLSRLGTLVRIRLDAERIDTLESLDARALSDEARAIGDDELASELDARARPAPYR